MNNSILRSSHMYRCAGGEKLPALLLSASLALPQGTMAQDSVSGSSSATTLPELLITAPVGNPGGVGEFGSGEYTFERDYIEQFGSSDGGLEGVLKLVPGIQFSEDSDGVEGLTDLKPESVSISGGRFYENRFVVDGLGNTNRLDPASASDGSGIDGVGGHEQSLFLDADLIGELKVYDSNIPAAYGGFTGGVVDARTRRAGSEAEGKLSISGTRSEWTEFRTFTREWDPESETLPPTPPSVPEFERYRANFHYSTPLTDSLGILTSISQAYSETPDVTLGQARNRVQSNQNVLMKMTSALGVNGVLDISATYAPFESESFLTDVEGSDYTVEGGGYSLKAGYDYLGDVVEHEVDLGWTRSVNSREAPNGYYSWENTRSRQWGREADVGLSREGGYGDLDTIQESSTLVYRLKTLPVIVGNVEMRHEAGTEISRSSYRYKRDETLFVYDSAVVNSDVQCRGITEDCVQEEQYFSGRRVYDADDTEVHLNEAALFAESTLEWGRLSGTLGVRYDYNDFLENHDLAFRTRATLDVFDDASTRLIAGYNRYYGAALLTYKLREARSPYYREYRSTEQNIVTDWERESGQGDYRYVFDDVKTPYSDEQVIGLEQALLGGVMIVKVVNRDNQDEFARTETETQEDGYRYYIMNNDGSSEYLGVSVGWNAVYGNTLVSLHGTWSETETNNADYDDPIDDTSPSEYVSYEGQRIPYGELDILRSDFNRPIVVNLGLSHRFSEQLSATANARYRGAYDQIKRTGSQVDGGLIDNGGGEVIRERLTVYEDEERKATLLFDLGINYRIPVAGDAFLVTGAELKNVLDDRVYTVSEGDSGIEPGRQLWLTLGLDF
ncbi:hypothetical protein [Marinobacter sp.]|uniref:hypothetical protein n=1 Tax=Marinobacter sp. TaxID=50741 RepID=UPI003566617D